MKEIYPSRDIVAKRNIGIAASIGLALLAAGGCTESPSGSKTQSGLDPRDHRNTVAPPGNTVTASTIRLDSSLQPKFVNRLSKPKVIKPTKGGGFDQYNIAMTQFQASLGLVDPVTLLPLTTTVWGYGGQYPGPTIESRSTSAENTLRPGMPVKVTWTNQLPAKHLLPVDTTLMCGQNALNCLPEVRTVAHLHGGHTDSSSDGNPDAWFTANSLVTGHTFDPALNGVYTYRNDQGAAALWYHDHAMSLSRLNVYAGLAGMYIIRDDNEDRLRLAQQIPDRDYEVPLVIQDKSFFTDGALYYPSAPLLDANGNPLTLDPTTGNPSPTVVPEFFGDTILVNGKAWPVMNVEPRRYRFRVLNGSNSRFYNMTFELQTGVPPALTAAGILPFNQIGTDGGLLNNAVSLTSLLLAPAERADLVVDFSDPAVLGKTIIIKNDANTPYPGGGVALTAETRQIMAFNVTRPLDIKHPQALPPGQLRTVPIPQLTATPGIPARELLLSEKFDSLGRLIASLGTTATGPMMWRDPVTETPKLGSTEIWTIVNNTPDAHPIHQHLVQFQILDRQNFDTGAFVVGQPSSLSLVGAPQQPAPNEAGLKDTVQARPGEVIRLIANYDLPGDYVWHCHILEHEDYEMMRPFRVVM